MQNSSVRFHIHFILSLTLPKLEYKQFRCKFFANKRVQYRNTELVWRIAYFCCRYLTVWMATNFIWKGINSFWMATKFIMTLPTIFWRATKFAWRDIKKNWRPTKIIYTRVKTFWRATLFVWMAPNIFWKVTKISMTLPIVFLKATPFVYMGTKSSKRGVFSSWIQ